MIYRRVVANVLVAALLSGSIPATVPAGEPAAAAPLKVRAAWARPTPPGSSVAAVYLTIVGGGTADRLVAARTDRASVTQVHAVTRDAGMTRMREANGVDIAAGARVRLAPEGLHLMLMDLPRPLAVGERFEVTLEFERAGLLRVPVAVIALDATPPAGG